MQKMLAAVRPVGGSEELRRSSRWLPASAQSSTGVLDACSFESRAWRAGTQNPNSDITKLFSMPESMAEMERRKQNGGSDSARRMTSVGQDKIVERPESSGRQKPTG